MFTYIVVWAKCVFVREEQDFDSDKNQVCVRNRNQSCSNVIGLQLFPVSHSLFPFVSHSPPSFIPSSSILLWPSFYSAFKHSPYLQSITVSCYIIYVHVYTLNFRVLQIQVESLTHFVFYIKISWIQFTNHVRFNQRCRHCNIWSQWILFMSSHSMPHQPYIFLVW